MKRIFYGIIIMLTLSMGLVAISCSSKSSKLEGYEWLEGKWKGDEVQQIFVNITPQYYQIVGELWDDDMNVGKAEKKNFSIKILNNSFLGDVKGICESNDEGDDFVRLYLDEAKKSIYWVYDFDQKIYLTKE